ncbi:hypothetical protein DEFDS_P016 (plasmid) [Deferribacter desulfuricans SSM1]|uniref:Uncharacterized protein n=1 Tax=Deferribacter desulfuricans (strain DSM 14783 / JCM 11476 / NBRC 101012 / SSM1) TaxID=639282 RepID=D3PEK2_DEFDS|nr:prepilin-type N-terminal cleavage/methylation domain-containing protein [Deferribacter desulfuricans]BAI81644.1 hypothetical protein DEFDS_P016 [Deferribacter desulfuricans SSM1]
MWFRKKYGKQQKKKKFFNNKGFTLMELIIVLGILLILYAAFKPNKQAKDSAIAQSIVQQIEALNSAFEICVQAQGSMDYSACTDSVLQNYVPNNDLNALKNTQIKTTITYSFSSDGTSITYTIPLNTLSGNRFTSMQTMIANMLKNKARSVTTTSSGVQATF